MDFVKIAARVAKPMRRVAGDMFQRTSEETQAACKGKDLSEVADSSCTTGYDNDGSSGYELFENGFQLAQKAAGKPVFVVHHPDEDVAFFFIAASEDEVRQRIDGAPEGEEEEEEDDGPPSEPGSPYDTLEEKRGEK